MDENKCSVSVVVVTYNSNWEKLAATLISILNQKNISFQIVIGDDGSSVFFQDKIISLFAAYNFLDYKFSFLKRNVGTVENICKAVSLCDGKYIKTISPGDYLYNENTLRNWIVFMEEKHARICFGDSIYYQEVNGKIQLVETASSPILKEIFTRKNNRKKLLTSYLIANDTILGAAIAFEKGTFQYLLKKIRGKLIYAEDYSLRIAIFENIPVSYYDEPVIWYEYGTGISTNNNCIWIKRLLNDFDMSNEIILADNAISDSSSRKYIKYLRQIKHHPKFRKVIKVCYYPSVIIMRCEMKRMKAQLHVHDLKINKSFIEKIRNQKEE